MTEFNRPTLENYNHVESMNRVKKAFDEEMAAVNAAFDEQYPVWKRNQVIEEVALHVEKLKGFGKDTIDSLTVYIREMKK